MKMTVKLIQLETEYVVLRFLQICHVPHHNTLCCIDHLRGIPTLSILMTAFLKSTVNLA